MNILELMQSDGLSYKKVANTRGGEYHGPCPFCGGNDRFRIQPARDYYTCRACGIYGDSIKYLREFRKMKYFDALILLGREPSFMNKPIPPILVPKQEKQAPPEAWQTKATTFAMQAQARLWESVGAKMRQWLREEKGLSDTTIKQAGLGFNPADIYEQREVWGLEPMLNDKGNPKKIWLPAGLVIPFSLQGKVQRLRIRRNDPGDGDRYIVASGSYMGPMILENPKTKAVILVESELDAILIKQEAGDLGVVVSLGSAQAKPNKATEELLRAAQTILIALDDDEAGAKAAWTFWKQKYGKKVKRWACLLGKDPSEARLNGLDLRTWIEAGLPDIPPEELKCFLANPCAKSNKVNDSAEEQVDIFLQGKETPPLEPPPIDAADQELIDWFMNTELPRKPFDLDGARRVFNPVKFCAVLKREIESRPSSPRWRCGATQADLRRLKENSLNNNEGGIKGITKLMDTKTQPTDAPMKNLSFEKE